MVYCIGETVLDIIFKDDVPLAAKPGGSMLNSAVSLGRAGVPVSFISDYGNDHPGDLIHRFLDQNNVSTEFVSRYREGKTALALAFLDNQQNASYSFYKIFPEERLTAALPAVQQSDIVLFGSFYALTASIRGTIRDFIQRAKSKGAYIIYDPNFRNAHLDELETTRPFIVENIGFADLIRGSDEDFQCIFGDHDARSAWKTVSDLGCPFLVYTKNSMGVEVMSKGFTRSFTVPALVPTSTIGAGDAFNAGIIYSLCRMNNPEKPSMQGIEQMIQTAILFSEDVCLSLDNYISSDFAKRIEQTQNKH
jgi:fructokinase